jgi:hypothetical protein
MEKEPVWRPSQREEVIAALWYIAAFSALEADAPGWVCIVLFIKAILDTLCFMYKAAEEIKDDE